jgi:myo-inositol-1-phosphate synthase
VRCAKLALDRGEGGALIGPSSYFMKSPPQQFTDHEARERTEAFIRNHEISPVKAVPRALKGRARAGA